MNAQRESLSWEPIRKGARYCAPACDRGCTWDEHQDAKFAAQRLVKRLGLPWEARVWENLGWHYSVRLGPVPGLVLFPNHDYNHGGRLVDYTAGIETGKYANGMTYHATAPTPEDAIRAVCKLAQKDVDTITTVTNAVWRLLEA